MKKKNTPKKAAAKATAKPAAQAAPEMSARRRWKVWEPAWETGARTVEGAEPSEAALEYCAQAYPKPDGNRCASVSASEAALGGRIRVFLRDAKPVHYLFVEAL